MRLAPDIPRDHRPGDGLASIPGEIRQQVEFARGEADFTIIASDAPALRIEGKICHLQSGHLVRPGTAKQRTQASDKLSESEWFDQVVVCAGVEPEDAVFNGIARGE